ncbi:MAG: molybdate ABC transporter permease subunit [Desulfurella sp.]|uniref:Molybdenum transport system permease n=2 Tax=Desulfurella TaxID=33001 RepID=A0A1G6I223_9BACT|nr:MULTISPECIES: molybdate ABC transporter permease subunit [Desulfurella]AHF97422.1 molybdenum ABC transporter permease [Desulfurella acetivorans A63]HEX13479.1 molybdate ABC transporter permease subunit [Desulfurella acetivorans]PMP68319.1 MAG: molybdate ABC transporter permease subunit [Desulfurella multipotens]PMP89728.1 MAG: molybdate ABC transporter permease subunit [Desulfurella sp.]SDC00587.1 molybdate transport system permease protein [Desulfurella multipotens]
MSDFLLPLYLTFKLAIIATVVLFFIGIFVAYFLAYTKSKLRFVYEALVNIPLFLPPIVLGFYILVIFSPASFLGKILEYFGIKLVFSFSGLVVGSILYSFPFMVNPLVSGFRALPKSLKEASYTLGKTKLETFFKVLLPNMKPSILSAVVLTFVHTIGEFGVVLMIGGNIPGVTKVASIAIFDASMALNYKLANFYSLVLSLVSLSFLMFVFFINKKFVSNDRS